MRAATRRAERSPALSGSRGRARGGRSLLVALVSGCVIAGAPMAVAGQVGPRLFRLDGVAAVVGGSVASPDADVILRSDVELRARLVLSGRSGEGLPLGPIPEALLAAALREIIGEHLIAREANRVAAAVPNEVDVLRERRRLARLSGGEARAAALLSALSAEAGELDRIARRRALVGAFLSANLEGTTVVSDAEVERAYANEKERFEGLDREVVLTELRSRLSREALDRSIARWVAVLEGRTEVRIYAEFDER